ncbi:MAG: hypothetical protein AAGJ31_06200, partial [Verrucomicrobiota bacterium]
MTWTYPLLLWLLFLSAAAAEPSDDRISASPPVWDGKQAHVTLPYSEIRALWEAAQHSREDPVRKPPPQDGLLRALHAEGTLTDTELTLNVRLEVESFVDEWHEIPLLRGTGHLIAIEPADATVSWSKDGYRLIRNEAGSLALTLRFSQPRSPSRRETLLALDPAPATVQTLRLTNLPPEHEVEWNGAVLPISDDTLVAAMDPEAGPWTIQLVPARTAAPEVEDAPSTWQLTSQIVAHPEDHLLHIAAQVFAQDLTGTARSLSLSLPLQARQIRITDSADLTILRPERRSGSSFQPLEWAEAGTDRQFDIEFSLPISPLADSWPLWIPSTENGSSEALVVIPLVDGLELEGDGLRSSSEASRLSPWFSTRLGNADFVSLQTTEPTSISPRWLPCRSTAQATISKAEYATQLERNGQTLNRATFQVEHEGHLLWTTTLPERCEILTCSVNGKAAHPVAKGDNTIELRLSTGGKSSSQIALTYAHR